MAHEIHACNGERPQQQEKRNTNTWSAIEAGDWKRIWRRTSREEFEKLTAPEDRPENWEKKLADKTVLWA